MANEFFPQTGSLKEVNEPRIVGEVIVDNLANSSEQPFSGIRRQLASGHLPNLAQRVRVNRVVVLGARC